MDSDTLLQFSAIIFNVVDICAKNDGQYGQLHFYGQVGVLIYEGVPLMPMSAIPRNLIRHHSHVELDVNKLSIIMQDKSRILFMPENNPQECISMTKDIYHFRHIGILNEGKFIGLPTAEYYGIEHDTLTFYTEHFDIISQMLVPICPRVYIDEIKTFASFDTCTIINGYVLKIGNIKRDGNWLYGIDTRESKVLNTIITPDQKCAFAYSFGEQIICNEKQSSITVYPLSMYICEPEYFTPTELQNAKPCKHIYGITGLYFGETHEGEIIQLQPRSATE